MPGNKSSGRRKSLQNINDLSKEIPVEKKKKPGRPKKSDTTNQSFFNFNQSASETVVQDDYPSEQVMTSTIDV